jgi:hypothetical protein
MTVRPETAAEFIGTTADLVMRAAALAEEAIRLVRAALADPAAEGLRNALVLTGAGLHEAAAAVRAQQPTVDMFAEVVQARRDAAVPSRPRLAVEPRQKLRPTA